MRLNAYYEIFNKEVTYEICYLFEMRHPRKHLTARQMQMTVLNNDYITAS